MSPHCPVLGAGKAHKHLAHKQFLGHPGHRSSRPGTRPDENVYIPWVPHTAHKLLTPGHRSGDRWPPGRETPPATRAVTGKVCLCLCAFSFPEFTRQGSFGLPIPSLSASGAKDPWLDSACADCPGFLVVGAAGFPVGNFL